MPVFKSVWEKYVSDCVTYDAVRAAIFDTCKVSAYLYLQGLK